MMAIICFGGITSARNASAQLVTLANPFGNDKVVAMVNFDPVPAEGGGTWISWQRVSDGACFFDQVGDDTGFDHDYMLESGENGDRIVIMHTLGTIQFCGFSSTEPNYNGHWMDIQGQGGPDDFETGDGDSNLDGGNGDNLLTGGRVTWVDSGVGDDTIWVTGVSNDGHYVSGGGNDCMHINTTATNAVMSCGNGTDQWYGPGTRPADCESTNFGCCPGLIC
jgi:Ca2+-binding RTX toxin-like protein